MHYKTTIFLFLIFSASAFKPPVKNDPEYEALLRLEHKALIAGKVGQTDIYDLSHVSGCNKTRITYLGVLTTLQGKKYKILTSFFVFRTGNNNCHGTSAIKVYDLKNAIVGKYSLGMPYDLPDALKNGKLIYLTDSKDCNERKGQSIDLSKGLPESFFIRCSDKGGDIFSFSAGE